MNRSAMPFFPGRTKDTLKGVKYYAAYLYRGGRARISRARRRCKTASEAQAYAERWAARANRMLGAE